MPPPPGPVPPMPADEVEVLYIQFSFRSFNLSIVIKLLSNIVLESKISRPIKNIGLSISISDMMFISYVSQGVATVLYLPV